MPAPTLIGTVKGRFGNLQSITGLVLESEDYDYKPEIVPFPDANGNTTAVAQFNEVVAIGLKGYLIAGTNWTGTLASTLTLSAMPAHLKTGNTGGTTIIEGIKIGNQFKDWSKVDITATYYPSVATV